MASHRPQAKASTKASSYVLEPVSLLNCSSVQHRGINMGKGIDLIRDLNPEHAAIMDDLKDQLLIVFLKRLGGEASISFTEIDDTGGDIFSFRIDENKVFHFTMSKKS